MECGSLYPKRRCSFTSAVVVITFGSEPGPVPTTTQAKYPGSMVSWNMLVGPHSFIDPPWWSRPIKS